MTSMRKLLSILAVSALALLPARADLIVNELYGFNVSGVAALPSISFQACSTDGTNLTTYTFNSVAIGTASATRRVILGVVGEDSATIFSISSATVDAVAATEVADEDGTGVVNSGIYISDVVSSGTTANVTVTFSEAIQSGTVCVWAVYDLNSPTATSIAVDDDTASGVVVLTLSTTTADGVAVGICGNQSNTSVAGWAVLNERFDSANGETAYTGADAAATGSSMSVTCDYSGTVDATGAAAAFR